MLLLSVNNVTTNIVRQSIKYVKSFKQNYDDQLGLLTKNGSPFYYIYIMIARSLIHVKELNCYQLRLQQLSRSNRKIMPSSHSSEDILSCIIFSCLFSVSFSFCKRFICCCNSNPLLIFLLGQIKLCSYYILNSDFQSVDFSF